MNAPENTALIYIPQWRESIGKKLFPVPYVEMPDMIGAKDGLHASIVTHFSFIDRLRILISGRTRTELRTATEGMIGNHLTNAEGFPAPPAWLERRERKILNQ